MEGKALNLKTYQAYTMAEALAAVKRDLGADAVILNTRTYTRGGMLGLRKRTVVELTATKSGEVEASRAAASAAETSRSRTAPRPAARPAGARAAARAYADGATPPPTGPDTPEFTKTRRLAQALLERQRRAVLAAAETPAAPADPSTPTFPEPGPVVPEPADEAAAAAVAAHEPAPGEPPTPTFPEPGPVVPEPADVATPEPAPVAQRFILTPSAKEPADAPVSGTVAAVAPAPTTAPAPIAGPEPDAVRDELSAIRGMVGEVLRQQVRRRGEPAPTMPQKLFDMYLKMIGQELSEELADRVVESVRAELTEQQLDDEPAVQSSVRRHLAEFIPTADEPVPPRSPDGRPLTLALIGPTGVGKTTTLAKLAASFKLRHKQRVGLITADTYRIAAVDQLRTYANIIGLPLKVVLSPGEMRQATDALRDCDVILIDTAGRGQNDSGRIEELSEFLAAAEPHEVHLVLSSTAGEKVLLREAEAFGVVGIDKVVLTKLDEAVSFGMLVNVIRQIGKEFSFFTTGQEVPHQIEVGQPGRLAELVLGEVVHA
jgi:flagellar biosynthesis protein FlhF